MIFPSCQKTHHSLLSKKIGRNREQSNRIATPILNTEIAQETPTTHPKSSVSSPMDIAADNNAKEKEPEN